MYKIRQDEPDYAFIADAAAPECNRYGKPIQLVDEGDVLAGKSLHINGDPSVGGGADRYKQHGFYFNADNCIACHACESACSEKNDLPPHLAFRSVGYVEGGTYPSYQRLNISMACNHCDDPVCLKGCPTRAYTKFAEYGAVLQDPDICFGCGYCTWVCPYNAPQLDPVKGRVEKCNMCVDRLEVGLKPACVAACLGNALDFGVIETVPQNRDQKKLRIPGFPTPDITQPNIRFQQTRTLPREMTRPDNMPLRYQRQGGVTGEYSPKVATGQDRPGWNLKQLHTREDPLVVFTLLSQAVVGAFMVLFLAALFAPAFLSPAENPLAYGLILGGLIVAQTGALALSTLHLGKPHRFYRAFNNLRYSPVSREVAGIALFYNLLLAYTLLTVWPGLSAVLPGTMANSLTTFAGWGAFIVGPVAIYFMYRIYRIRARPFWDHWQTLSSFMGSVMSLGGTVGALFYTYLLAPSGETAPLLLAVLALVVALGLALEGVGLICHRRAMHNRGGEGAASQYVQASRFGKTYRTRNLTMLLVIGVMAVMMFNPPASWTAVLLWWGVFGLVLGMAVTGRALFYALVVPTTLPRAFFWRNAGFESHARQTGLAALPQVGVIADSH
ncbi:MAG: dimethyl sulfoxide reductase anchor subunit [Gammaproteobacteria bacterium]|nr:dimethyl sulfoxide reductase anchor subunit [Gammaproteobacteria bacterium]